MPASHLFDLLEGRLALQSTRRMEDKHSAAEAVRPGPTKEEEPGRTSVQSVRWQLRRRSSSVPNLRIFIEDERNKRKARKHPLRNYRIEDDHHSESLFSVVSVLYAVFIIVMGATLAIADLFAKNSNMHIGTFEGFYVYLFVASISFLVFVQLFIIRDQKNSARVVVDRLFARCRSKSKDADRAGSSSCSSAGKGREAAQAIDRRAAMSLNSHAHTGGFFLRLGAVGFGIGAMILEGLNFGEYLEKDPGMTCTDVTEVVRPLLQMIFILSQTYFIFRNSKMVIHRYRGIARFGMMHMVATNLCVWLRVIAIETMHELHHADHGNHHDDDPHHHDDEHDGSHGNYSRHRRGGGGYDIQTIQNDSDVHYDQHSGCGDGHGATKGLLTPAIDKVGPYLFACTVEYSLIEAGVMYLMWCNIHPLSDSRSSSSTHDHRPSDSHSSSKPSQRIRVDWSGTNRGLFLGFFALTLTIINLVVFFNLKAKHDAFLNASAVVLMLTTKLVIDVVSVAAVCGAAVKFRDLRFDKDVENPLDQILLLVALVGLYLFNVLASIAATHRSKTRTGALMLATAIVSLFQATVQTMFILNGLRRSAGEARHEVRRPGRQFVTFLIVSNTALWGINSFEVLHASSHPTAMEFYGFMPWSIITHVSVPLMIFYRYHSTVCLVDIWKDAYKTKGHGAHH